MASEMFPHLKIPLEDVVKATNNFHPDNIIGHGDFGPAYKGQLEWSGKSMTIAARRLDRTHGLGGFEFSTEVSALSDLKHTNIVSIIGFCDEKGEQIIVTTYEANGSLGQFLDSPSLTWTERLRICVGMACALSYLHSGEGRGNAVIHRFINSSTILLDENWEAKLSGFELSIKQSVHQMNRVVLSKPIGTTGYMDPAIVKTGGVTHKSDIYSFGIVLFEILCGRKAYIPNKDNVFLDSLAKYHYENKTLQDIIHPDLCNQMSRQSLMLYSKVAYSCLEKEPSHRPDMDYVFAKLKKALEAQTRRERLVKKLEHLEIHLKDIKLATDNFSEAYVIGYEAYCTLYIAQLDHFDNRNPSSREGTNKDEPSKRNSIVVIKCMNEYADREEFLFTEIEMLMSVKHSNITTLLGYCLESDEMILVTNNIVSKGYLSQYLGDIYYNDRRALTWEKRLKICIDVAKALSYLHYDMEDKKIIINLNLSNKNIGLDENWVAKITEFGFSAFLPPDQVDEGIHMRYFGFQRCYMDPEHEKTMKVKRESDVYSFGVILFEILCGRMANDPIYLRKSFEGLADVARKRIYTGTFKDMIDPIIMEETYEYNSIQYKGPNKDSLHAFIKIANQCVTKAQNERPTMKVVVEELEKALSVQEDRAQHPEIKNALELQLTDESIPEEGVQHVDTDEHELTVEEMLESELMHINGISEKNEHLRIHLDDIKHATDNFSDAAMLSYDQYYFLYRVKLYHFNIEHPIYGTLKRIRPEYGGIYTEENFYKDIEVLSSVKHPNIVTLFGFCVEGSEKIVLMDDVSNGQLCTCLDNINKYKNILTWERRLKICIDLAHALNYIHCKIEDQKKIVNNSICGNMIGLDENWRPKIIEFGFSTCLLPYPLGSGDNAFFNILKRERDVYDFGVLVFEILCGRKATDPVYRKENVNGLADAARCGYNTGTLENMIDPIIKGETCENNFVLNRGPNKNSLNTFIKIALKCVAEYQWERPAMEFVVKELEKALYLQKNNKDNPIISLEDIKIATKNFKDCIGGGGFGNVYVGNLQDGDGRFKTIVAKKLNKMSDQGEKQFLTELQILLEYKHENVIGLVGYCNEMDEKIIVYEYAPKGSLDKYLGDTSLTWIKRLNICIDVARALDFLHGGVGKQAKVIHRDIKSENILLNDDWKAKLADFGLSLISPLTHESDYIIEHWCGTPGYMDPLYHKSRLLTIESDIYSFGVVLFEMMCGKSTFAINKHEGHYLPDFVKSKYEERKLDKVVFEPMREQILPESLAVFQEIAYQCLEIKREKRPTMKEVLRELKNALEFQNMASSITKCAPFKIPLEDVLKGTNNFHQDNIIGHGRFGSLYKGQLLLSGNLVNVTARRLDHKHGLGDLEFWTEVAVLFDLRHTNLVSIIGFCNEKDEKIILTTYEVNGNLRGHLNSSNLTWKQRLMICIGAARALSYLHHDDGRCERDYYIIHRIINSGTILLDENWEAKLSCFEYFIKHPYKDQFRLYEPIDVMGYMDPSIERMGGVAHKSDVYSFGVVLFEILCGREAHIPTDPNMFLAPLARSHYENESLQEIILPGLWDQMSQQSLLVYSRAAYSCLEEEPAQRPEMYHIVAELEKALSLQNMASTITKCAHLQIPLEDVVKATNNFHHDNIIGHGGIGQLYIGQLLQAGNFINITAQRLDRENGQRDLVFWTEVTVLSDLMHTNLVSIIGFCDEKDEKIIIASYEANGSLRKHLNNPNVTWIQRLRVCVGVARALSYLHYSKGRDYAIIHRIINSSTILVDENWEAKLSCFEFSIKQLYNDEVCFYEPIGPPWYIDPSVEKTGGVTHKSDIYSFGVVLFEILCGREAYIENEPNMHLTPLARYHYENNTLQDIILPDLWNQMSPQSLLVYSKIAYSCLAEEPAHRPDVDYIVAELETALSLQLNPEVKSDYVENTQVSVTEIHAVKLSGELNNMTMTGESGKSEHHNEEKLSLPDEANDSGEYSGCCWPCGFRKIKNHRKAATPSRPNILEAHAQI